MTRIPGLSDRSIRRRPARCCAALALAYVAGLAITASSAKAIGTVDSNCPGGNSGGFAIVSYGAEWAQTFPAARSGKLLTVDVKGIARQPEGKEDINVHLYGLNESGVPVAPALSETTIPSASIPTDAVARDYTANFNPEAATYLEAGKTYAIGISSNDPKQDSWNFQAGNSCPADELLDGPSPFHPFNKNTEWDAGLVTYLGPENDDFERAMVLSGQNVAVEGTTAGGTRQTGEPDHYVTNPPDSNLWVGDHSVWFHWTAPNSGPTTIDTCVGEIDSILAVYTGSQLNSLTRVADNNNDPACTSDIYGSKVSFEAVAGTTYDIAVGDAGGAREKPFTLTIAGAPDTTPPDTQIDSGPSGPTGDGSPSFTFTSEPGATFECRLDSSQEAAFQACVSPKSYNSLPSGLHNFEVRAIDEAGNRDPTPAARSFTIEAMQRVIQLPDSVIRKVKVSQAKDTATFGFSSTAPASTFLCKLDRKPFKGCKSPKTYRHLKPGKHRFQVEALDSAGDRDPTPAVRAFKLRP
jgi:hypothetical protein